MKKIHLFSLALALVASGFLASCKKDSIAEPGSSLKANGIAAAPTAGGLAVPFDILTGTKGTLALSSDYLYMARNFHQGTVPNSVDTTQWSSPSGTYYYRLCSTNDGGNSSNYDFKFQGTATGDFVADTAKFDVYYVDAANTPFASVISTTAPSGTGVVSVPNGTLGINGWYTYVFAVHTVTAISGRTIILKVKTGKSCGISYKIRINSIYWNETPAGSPYPTNFPFYSFDYEEL